MCVLAFLTHPHELRDRRFRLRAHIAVLQTLDRHVNRRQSRRWRLAQARFLPAAHHQPMACHCCAGSGVCSAISVAGTSAVVGGCRDVSTSPCAVFLSVLGMDRSTLAPSRPPFCLCVCPECIGVSTKLARRKKLKKQLRWELCMRLARLAVLCRVCMQARRHVIVVGVCISWTNRKRQRSKRICNGKKSLRSLIEPTHVLILQRRCRFDSLPTAPLDYTLMCVCVLVCVGVSGAVARGPALRSGDSFGGDIPQDRQRRFAGDTGTWSGPACIDEAAQARLRRRQQRRDVPRGGHAESKASGGGGKAESKQTLRHEWKVRTHQPAQTFRRDGSDEDNGAGAMGDTSFVTDKVSVADARAALRGGKTPAGGAASSRDSAAPLVPANVTVTEGGRRLYRGRTAEQLEKRRQRRAKAKAQAAKRRSVKRLTGVTSRTEDVAGDQSLHEMVASGHLSADGRPIRGVRGTGRGVSVGAAEAERRNNPSQGDRRERYGGSGSVAASQMGGGSVGVGSAPKHVPWGTVPEFLADVQLPQYAQAFQDEDMTDMGLLVGLAANSDRAALRSTLKELGVTKLGHFEKIVQRLAPYTA